MTSPRRTPSCSSAPPALLDAEPLLMPPCVGLDGLRGSDDPADVVCAGRFDRNHSRRPPLGIRRAAGKLRRSCPQYNRTWFDCEREGSPRMQGAAWGALAMLAQVSMDRLGAILASWYDGASTGEGRGQLRSRLQGLLVPLLPLVSSDPEWLSGLESRLASSADDEFLVRLPALRGGFQTLTPADRARLLSDRLAVLEPGGPATTAHNPSAIRSRSRLRPPPTVPDARRSLDSCPTFCSASPGRAMPMRR